MNDEVPSDPLTRRKRAARDTMRSILVLHRLQEPECICGVELMAIPYMINKFRSYPLMMVEHGANPFIHPRIYRRFPKPYPLTLVDRLCSDNIRHLRQGGESRLRFPPEALELVLASQSRVVSFLDCLGFVQALITIQILTMFSNNLAPEERQAVHDRQKMLASWSKKLWAVAPTELPGTLSPCDSYALAETVRRTMLVAYILQALYCLSLTGSFVHTAFGSALPFDASSGLWEARCHIEGTCRHSSNEMDLTSYREYVDRFEAGGTGTLTLFQKMMVVGCHGVASVEPGVELPPSMRASAVPPPIDRIYAASHV